MLTIPFPNTNTTLTHLSLPPLSSSILSYPTPIYSCIINGSSSTFTVQGQGEGVLVDPEPV